MIQTIIKSITFEEFLEWYPDGKGRFELGNGVIVEINKNGEPEEVTGFLIRKINVEIDSLNLPYLTPSTYFVRPPETTTGYQPDLIVLDKPALISEPLWKKLSVISHGISVKLVVEVVSTNWQDDYLVKVAEYERLGIPEYWVLTMLPWVAGATSAIPNNLLSRFTSWLMGSTKLASSERAIGLFRLPSGNLI